jgi:hypothetical protein
MAALGPAGGGNVTVQVVDQRSGGAQPEVQESRGANGDRQIRVIIRDTMRGLLSDGSMDAAMRANYALPRRGA